MKKGWKILIGIIVVVAVIIFIAKLIIGAKIKPIIEKEATKILGTPVHLGGVKLGFLIGEVGVRDFWIANPEGFSKDKLFSFDSFGVKVSYPALLKKQIIINRVYLKKPAVAIELASPKKINVLALVEKMPKKKEPVKKEEKPLPQFLVKNISVSGGQLKLVDAAFSTPAATHSIDNFHFELKNLTNLPTAPEDAGRFKLTAALDRKSPINVEGKISPFAKKISFNVKGGLKNFNLTDFASYYQKAPVAINNGQAEVAFTLDCLKEVLSGLASVQVKNLQVTQKTSAGPMSNLANSLTQYIKDSQGILAFDFKIGGTLKKPVIGFMEALNKLIGNILSNVARKAVGQAAENIKNQAVREVTRGIKWGR
jgi:uncharacterized protein involved in outer membrane biogenesis